LNRGDVKFETCITPDGLVEIFAGRESQRLKSNLSAGPAISNYGVAAGLMFRSESFYPYILTITLDFQCGSTQHKYMIVSKPAK
jgi:hypothetical protein